MNTWLRAAVAVTTLLSAVIAGGLWRVGARITELQSKENLKTQEKIAAANNNAQQAILGQKTLEESTERLRHENLTLQLTVEQERLARLKIEERLESRHISHTQLSILKKELQRFSGEKITVITSGMQPEVSKYSHELTDALKAAGLDATFQSALLPTSHSGFMFVSSTSRLKTAWGVADALTKAGLVTGKIPLQQIPSGDDLQIVVGPKE